MQLARDELLARSALAHDEHRARDRRHAGDGVGERAHGRTAAEERAGLARLAANRLDFGEDAPPLHRALDLAHDALDGLVLVDETVGAGAHRLHAAIVAPRAGVHDDGRIVPALAHRPQNGETIHARHLEVEHDAVDGLDGERGERIGPGGRNVHVEACEAAEVVRVLLGERTRVVDDENAGHGAGESRVTHVPAPGAVSMRRVQPRSVVRRLTIDRPRPVPWGLVV